MLVVTMCPADRQHTVRFLLTIFIFKRFNEDADFVRVCANARTIQKDEMTFYLWNVCV